MYSFASQYDTQVIAITVETDCVAHQLIRRYSKTHIQMHYLLLVTAVLLAICIHALNSQVTNQVIECSTGESQCGSRCYSLETHKCNSGFVCHKDESWCGNKCFNPITQRCFWGLVCLKSEGWCENKCFDPTTQHCHRGKLNDKNATNI
jgi:hypothetical protein